MRYTITVSVTIKNIIPLLPNHHFISFAISRLPKQASVISYGRQKSNDLKPPQNFLGHRDACAGKERVR